MWSGTQEHVLSTRRGGDCRSDRHGHVHEHEIRGWKCFIRASAHNASKDIRLFHHSGHFAILADGSALQWFAKELNEALLVWSVECWAEMMVT